MTVEPDVALVVQDSARVVLEVSGPVDAFTRGPLDEALRRALGYREVTVDLTRVTFFSAAGAHALETAEEALAEHGGLLRLVAAGAGPVDVVLQALDMQDRWPVEVVGPPRREEPGPFEQGGTSSCIDP